MSELNLGRFSELAPEQMSPEQRAARQRLLEGARGSVPPPYRIWLHSPGLVQHLDGLGNFLLRGASLTPRENEIAILTVARQLKCPFVMAAHTRVGKRVGLEDPVIERLLDGKDPQLADPRERAVYDVATALPAGPPPEELYRRAIGALGEHGVAELTGLLGYYTSVSYILNFHDVPKP
jgi:4-carboxymuconolactone decarboxylase